MRKLLFLAIFIFVPVYATAQTADEIIAKYVEARGSLNKIRSIQSERVTGSIVFAPGVICPFVVERERPYKMRMEMTYAGQTLIRVYDGKSKGWVYNPFAQHPAVEEMTAGDLRNILDEADFEGPLVDYKTKGNHLEYVGKTDVEGKQALKIKLTDKNGDVSYFSIDAATYLMLRWQGNRKSGEKEIPSETYFRDFREIDGLQYPFLIESNAPGTDQTQKIMADKIEVNVAISESRFTKPVVAPLEVAPPAPAAPGTSSTPPSASPPNPVKPQ